MHISYSNVFGNVLRNEAAYKTRLVTSPEMKQLTFSFK